MLTNIFDLYKFVFFDFLLLFYSWFMFDQMLLFCEFKILKLFYFQKTY